jgi:hypothetical protein
MERRRAVGPISTRRVRIGDPIFPRRPRSRSTPLYSALVYFISFLFLWNIQKEGSVKKEKEKKRTRIFSQSRGPGAVQPVVVLFAHKKLFYAPCVVVLYTLFLGTISCKAAGAGPSARIMDCKHSLTVKVLHTTPSTLARLLCLRRWHCYARRCASLFIQKLMYVREGWYTCCRL